MSNQDIFDIVVIGAGPGGYAAAFRAADLGKKVVLIDRDKELGGVCLNWGCIPTKALLKSAEVFEYLKKASDFGLKIEKYDKDFNAVVNRSRSVADKMSKGVNFLMKKNKIEVLNGHGKLLKNKKILIKNNNEEVEISADKIIIATGSRSRVIDTIPQNGKNIIGYREAMTLTEQPKELVIVGSGAIGIEFAYFFNSMGTKVTIIEYLDRILPNEDEEISSFLEKNFKKNGINILTSTKVLNVIDKNKDVSVEIDNKNGKKTLTVNKVLSAVGIKSNIENIGIEDVGISVDKDKIIVDKFYNTNIPGYFAIGDITTGPSLAHVASAEGILCVEKITGKDVEPIDYENIPGCTYCNPEVASVGLTEKKALEKGYKIKVGKFPFSASGKAQTSGKSEGFIKVIFDAKYGEWLGCHMIGAGVTDMIAEAVLGRKLETTGHEVLKSIHPHPTMSEAVMEAVADAYDEVIHI